MQKFIDVWVCQNSGKSHELCISDREDIKTIHTGWEGVGNLGELRIGWLWIDSGHPSYNLFKDVTKFPNKVKAKLLIPHNWRDLVDFDVKLI